MTGTDNTHPSNVSQGSTSFRSPANGSKSEKEVLALRKFFDDMGIQKAGLDEDGAQPGAGVHDTTLQVPDNFFVDDVSSPDGSPLFAIPTAGKYSPTPQRRAALGGALKTIEKSSSFGNDRGGVIRSHILVNTPCSPLSCVVPMVQPFASWAIALSVPNAST